MIGRINDSKLNDPNWELVRDVQVKIAQNSSHERWIDTDDRVAPSTVCASPKELSKIGQRFAQKAIDLIRKKKELQKIKE